MQPLCTFSPGERLSSPSAPSSALEEAPGALGWPCPSWSAQHRGAGVGAGGHRCLVQMAGLRREVSPGSGMPGPATKSCPGDVCCAGSFVPALGAHGGPGLTPVRFLGQRTPIRSRCYSLVVLAAGGLRSRCRLSFSKPGEDPDSPCPSSSWWLGAFLGLGPPSSNLCLPAPPVPGCKAHPYPVRSPLVPSLIPSAETLFSDKVMFRMDMNFGRRCSTQDTPLPCALWTFPPPPAWAWPALEL